MLSSFTVRCFLYPLTLIRTRLQVATVMMVMLAMILVMTMMMMG